MFELFQIISLVLGALFYTILGLGLLALILSEARHQNLFYRVLRTVASPALRLAGWILPRPEAETFLRILVVPIALVLGFASVVRVKWLLLQFGLLVPDVHVAMYTFVALLVMGFVAPPHMLYGYVRGIMALLLVQVAAIGLFVLFQIQGWIPAIGTAPPPA